MGTFVLIRPTQTFYERINPVYVGSLVWGAGGGYHKRAKLSPVRVDYAFEPIVDLSTFDRVQSTLRARAPKASPPRRVSSRYLLSGILRCGRCDAAMFGTGAKSGRFHYYVCATAYRSGKQACITRPLPQSMMEQLVLDNLQKLVLEEEHIEELVHLTNDELRGSLESLKERISGIDSQLDETDRRLGRLYDALETGKIVVEDLAPRIRELRERRDLLLRSKAEAQETVDAGRVELVSRGVVFEYLKDLKGVLDYGSVSERRALLKSFVRSVERHDSEVTVRYTLPLPPETEPSGGPGVLDSVLVGGAGGYRNRTYYIWLWWLATTILPTNALPNHRPGLLRACFFAPCSPRVAQLLINDARRAGLSPPAWPRRTYRLAWRSPVLVLFLC